MRIALLSDIHGNLVALDTVLAELAKGAPDQIVCLSDIAEGGLLNYHRVSRVNESLR